jgi:hypothetical protein
MKYPGALSISPSLLVWTMITVSACHDEPTTPSENDCTPAVLKLSSQSINKLGSCTISGKAAAVYSFTLAQSTAVTFRETASAFVPRLILQDSTGFDIGNIEGIEDSAINTATLNALLPSGTFTLIASQLAPGSNRDFVVTASNYSAPGGCDQPFVARGLDIAQSFFDKPCKGFSLPFDFFILHLKSDQTTTISITFPGHTPNISLLDTTIMRTFTPDSTVGVGTSTMTQYYTSPVSLYLTLLADNGVLDALGSYTLQVK